MKISELITELEIIKEKHFDMNVYLMIQSMQTYINIDDLYVRNDDTYFFPKGLYINEP